MAEACSCGAETSSSAPSHAPASGQPCTAGGIRMSMLPAYGTRVGWSARRPPTTAQPSRVPTTCSGPGELLGRPQRRVPPPAAAGEFAAGVSRGAQQPGSGSSSSGGGFPQAAAAAARTAAAASKGAAAAAAAAAPEDAHAAEIEVLKLVGLLPPSVRQRLKQHSELPLLLEVVMDLGR